MHGTTHRAVACTGSSDAEPGDDDDPRSHRRGRQQRRRQARRTPYAAASGAGRGRRSRPVTATTLPTWVLVSRSPDDAPAAESGAAVPARSPGSPRDHGRCRPPGAPGRRARGQPRPAPRSRIPRPGRRPLPGTAGARPRMPRRTRAPAVRTATPASSGDLRPARAMQVSGRGCRGRDPGDGHCCSRICDHGSRRCCRGAAGGGRAHDPQFRSSMAAATAKDNRYSRSSRA